jgi:hypothetical protein
MTVGDFATVVRKGGSQRQRKLESVVVGPPKQSMKNDFDCLAADDHGRNPPHRLLAWSGHISGESIPDFVPEVIMADDDPSLRDMPDLEPTHDVDVERHNNDNKQHFTRRDATADAVHDGLELLFSRPPPAVKFRP